MTAPETPLPTRPRELTPFEARNQAALQQLALELAWQLQQLEELA